VSFPGDSVISTLGIEVFTMIVRWMVGLLLVAGLSAGGLKGYV